MASSAPRHSPAIAPRTDPLSYPFSIIRHLSYSVLEDPILSFYTLFVSIKVRSLTPRFAFRPPVLVRLFDLLGVVWPGLRKPRSVYAIPLRGRLPMDRWRSSLVLTPLFSGEICLSPDSMPLLPSKARCHFEVPHFLFKTGLKERISRVDAV